MYYIQYLFVVAQQHWINMDLPGGSIEFVKGIVFQLSLILDIVIQLHSYG